MSPTARVQRLREAGRAAPAVPALLAAMTIWGATYVVTKVALPDVGPFTIMLLRLVIATVALVPFAWRQGYRPKLSLQKQFVLFALTGMVLHLGFEILGLEFTSASTAVLIIATAPVVTAALSIVFLGERLKARQGVGIALSIAGVILISGAQAPAGYPLSWVGSLLVFAGVLSWGIFTVQGKKMSTTLPWLVSTTAATGAAVLLSLPLAVGEIAVSGMPRFTAGAIAAILYLGLFAQAIAYAIWNLALEHVDGTVAGAYVNLVPVTGVGLALAAGETLTPLQLAGGATVALGVWLNHRAGAAHERVRPSPAAMAAGARSSSSF